MSTSDKDFIAEAEEILSDASATLLDIQESLPDSINPDSINGLFRAMHTLKGMSGLFGYQGMSDISHNLESILDLVRLGKLDMSEDVSAFMFKYLDLLKQILDDLRKGVKVGAGDVKAHVEEIEAFASKMQSGGESGSLDSIKGFDSMLSVLSEYEEHRLKSNIKAGKGIYLVSSVFSLEDFDVRLKDLSDLIKTKGELISTMPTSEGIPVGSIGFRLIAGAAISQKELAEVTGQDVQIMSEPGATAAHRPAAAPRDSGSAEADSSLKSSSTLLRVDISKIDTLLDTVGELSLINYSLKNIWGALVDAYGSTPLAIDMFRVSQGLDRKLGDLQEQVLEIRMVPVGQVFSRLSQVVRRYSMKAGKKISLQMFGDETEIDKYIAEELVDPLMHIVRNAIDHGIESAELRAVSGKPEEGTVKLRATQRGSSVLIEVEDDGGGINEERVRQKALEKGIINEDAVLGKKDILELLFAPGFSTAAEVSETSGRGVGLDVVREKLTKLGGVVEIESKAAEGTRFTLTLPITLAIVRSLIVRVASESFVVPLSSMSETFTIDEAKIQDMDGRLVCNLRGEMLPLVRLRKALELGDHEARDGDTKRFVLVVGSGERRMGLEVDEIKGKQEIVIKPLSDYFKGVRGFAGATEVGRHEVLLVLDVESIITESLTAVSGAKSGV